MSAHEETPKPTPEGRDSNGRFAKGNPGGPGNPFARRVAQMRSLALEVVTDDDLAGILKKLVELAKEGDVAAAKVVLQYTLGKPIDQPHPDRLDRDEVTAIRENSVLEGDQHALSSVPLGAALLLAREAWTCKGRRFLGDFFDALDAQDQAAAVNKPGQPKHPATVSAGPGPSVAQTEAIRLVNEPGARASRKGRRAANKKRR